MQINKETIEQLFRQHYLRMYQLARVLLKDDAASKDVVSEVFADVLDGKTQLGLDNETIASDSPLPSTNAGSYLLVCVRHKCLNLLSRQKTKDRVHHLLKADTSPSIQGRRIKLRCPPKVLTDTLHPSLPSIFSG